MEQKEKQIIINIDLKPISRALILNNLINISVNNSRDGGIKIGEFEKVYPQNDVLKAYAKIIKELNEHGWNV